MTDTSAVKGTNPSSTAGWPCIAASASGASPGAMMRACPLPSYPSRVVFRIAGAPMAPSAASSIPASSTAAQGAVARPSPFRKVFSATRS